MRLTICCWLFREGSSFSVLVSVWLGLPHIMCLEFRDEHPDIEREREKRRGRKRWVGRMRRSRRKEKKRISSSLVVALMSSNSYLIILLIFNDCYNEYVF